MNLRFLQGYRRFKTEDEIKQSVLNHILMANSGIELSNVNSVLIEFLGGIKHNEGPDFSIEKYRILKIFENSTQQTWIVATYSYMYCLLDDIDEREDKNIIIWSILKPKSNELSNFIKIYPSSKYEKAGLIDFGKEHKRWLYSYSLFSLETDLFKQICRLVDENGTQNQNVLERERIH